MHDKLVKDLASYIFVIHYRTIGTRIFNTVIARREDSDFRAYTYIFVIQLELVYEVFNTIYIGYEDSGFRAYT